MFLNNLEDAEKIVLLYVQVVRYTIQYHNIPTNSRQFGQMGLNNDV